MTFIIEKYICNSEIVLLNSELNFTSAVACSHGKIIFSYILFFLSIMINNALGLVDWSIICISPGIRNLITYIERSE